LHRTSIHFCSGTGIAANIAKLPELQRREAFGRFINRPRWREAAGGRASSLGAVACADLQKLMRGEVGLDRL